MKQVNFGMIGTGGIAQSQHLPNSLRAPHLKLVCACDLREDVLKDVQKKYDIPRITTNYKEMLSDPSIEAVFVMTRENMQAKLTIEALEAGKHVYVEKPLAATAEECRQVADAQKRTRKHVAVGHNRRFAPAYVKAKEIANADGGPKNIYYRISDTYHYTWGKNLPLRERVIHEVCHIFDILRWFTGSEVETIYTLEARPDDELINLKFTNGATAVIMNTGYTTLDFPKERVEMVTNYGAITVEDFVEMRTFGYRDYEPVYRFEGHTHAFSEYTHRDVYKFLGAEYHYAIKRALWKHWHDSERKSEITDPFEKAEFEYYEKYHRAQMPLINYQVDKGWVRSIDEFARCIGEGTTPPHASALDAYKGSILGHASQKSLKTGQIVKVEY